MGDCCASIGVTRLKRPAPPGFPTQARLLTATKYLNFEYIEMT
jgi:hypothetical protein